MLVFVSNSSNVNSQSQHHLRAHCSYKSHIPQINSPFSWLWVSEIALHGQQGWGLFDARSTWGNTRGNQGDAVTIRRAFPPSHFLCLTPANNHPLHTRLFNWAVYTQDASSVQVQKKLFFQFSWQDAEELVLRKPMFQPLPLFRNDIWAEGDTHSYNHQKQPLLGIPQLP